MSAEKSHLSCTSRCYRITVEGKINPSWSDWLSNVQLVSHKESNDMFVTTLSGVLIDQAALRGLLNRLWDLNLNLRSIEQIEPAPSSNNE